MNPLSVRFAVPLLGALLCAPAWSSAPDESQVLIHYADLAQASYQDALGAAKSLSSAVDTLIADPTEPNLVAARDAWKAARIPYQQTEVFRFGNPIVDAWEGKVNAWPLDEGLIDYVSVQRYGEESEENPLYTANVIANPQLTIGGRSVDARQIDKDLIATDLHEADGIETNVAAGYHAIEFLLWGQDLNGTGPGAGERPASDYDRNQCTGGNCERRAAYLKAATELLVDDLAWMTEQWGSDGAARKALLDRGPKAGLAAILTGMGSLSYGELAGERMRLGLMLNDPEEEHDCFSDNTHQSHYYDVIGIQNVYLGRYLRTDGSQLQGPSVADLAAAANPEAEAALRALLAESITRFQVLVESAEKEGVAYDQLIGPGNSAGNAKVQAAIDALVAQTKAIETVIAALNLESVSIEGSDSLDAPESISR